MKKVVFYLIAAAAVLTTACKDDEVAVIGVSLDENTITIVQGRERQLEATVLPDNATNKGVRWESDDKSTVTVDNNGLVKGVKSGTAVITVTTVSGGHQASCTVHVLDPVAVSGVLLTQWWTIDRGETIRLIPTVLPENANNLNVTWVSSKPDVATVNENGEVTGVAIGTTDITVTTEEGNFKAICKLTVANVVLKQPAIADIWYLHAKMSWKSGNTITHLLLEEPENSSDEPKTINLEPDVITAGNTIVYGLMPNTTYRVTIFNAEQSYNFVMFKTPQLPYGEIDVPAEVRGADIDKLVNDLAFEGMVLNLAGGTEYTNVRLRIKTSITIKGGEGTKITTAGNQKMYGVNKKMEIIFDNIHFIYTGASGADLFNVDADKGAGVPSINVELLAFKNCIIENVGRNMWQTSDNNDIVDEFVIDNCLITGQSAGNRRVIGWPNRNNKLGKVVVKNSTFVNLNRVVNASIETPPDPDANPPIPSPMPMNVIVENCTFYDLVGADNLFDLNNQIANVSFTKCLFAKGTNANIVRTTGNKTSTNNYHLNDITFGSNVIDPMTSYDKSSNEVFTEPDKLNFNIKDATFKALGIGDPKWLK